MLPSFRILIIVIRFRQKLARFLFKAEPPEIKNFCPASVRALMVLKTILSAAFHTMLFLLFLYFAQC
jgi:hypothetical protein